MGIFVRKLVKRKWYMLRIKYTKFLFKNMVFPFKNGPYYSGPSNAGLY